MTDHVRTAALSLAWTLVACHRNTEPVNEPIVGPGAIAEVEGDRGALSITPIPQLTPVESSEWRFQPGSERFSTTEFGDCSIFDVATGRMIHRMHMDEAPCVEWPLMDVLTAVPDISADGKLEMYLGNTLEIVEVESGKSLRTLACPDCATLDTATWSKTGHQLAVAWMNPPRVEVWDADTGKQIAAEQIPLAGELEDLQLGWTAGGATVLWTEQGFAVECEDSYQYGCYWDEDAQMMQVREASRQILLLDSKTTIPLGKRLGLDGVSFDPEGRWAFWEQEWSEGREGTVWELNFEALAGQAGGPSWQATEFEYERWTTRTGEWRNDGLVHWAMYLTNADDEASPGAVYWETTIASPPIGRREGAVIEDLEWGAEFDVLVFGFVGDALRTSGEVCNGESCTPVGVVAPPGCQLLDVASGHGTELFDCEGQLFMRNTGGMKQLPHDPGTVEWWWSRGGALVLHDGVTFTVLDAASGAVSLQRNDFVYVFEGRLGLELERLLLKTDVGLELLDLASAKIVANFPDLFPDDAAFSPNGDRVALMTEGQVSVISLPAGEPLASWPNEDAYLAFRQDGKVIFTGTDMPSQAFDAATGKPIDPATLEPIFEQYTMGEIDPSWRWIMNDETGELVRTLDGLTLTWLTDGAWLPATGQYQGAGPGPEIAYRVGNEVMDVPEFDAGDLAKWLRRDDLAVLFLSGQPIPKPSITAGELAGVRAGLEGKKK